MVDEKSEQKSFTVEDSSLLDSLSYLKDNNLLPENKSSPHFDSVKEAEDAAKEDVVYAVNESLNTLKQDMSDLQKKGYDELVLLGIRLLEIPLKVKVWLATCERKDIEPIFAELDRAKKIVDPLKVDAEEKEQQKEEEQKRKEAEEKRKEQEKANIEQSKGKGEEDVKQSKEDVEQPKGKSKEEVVGQGGDVKQSDPSNSVKV